MKRTEQKKWDNGFLKTQYLDTSWSDSFDLNDLYGFFEYKTIGWIRIYHEIETVKRASLFNKLFWCSVDFKDD